MAGLEVQIGANAAELEAEIDRIEKIIKNLEKKKKINITVGADTADLDKKIDAANEKLKKLKKGLDETTPGINKFNNNTRGAGNTLTQFSRIAQDAPFGIIAIGNNITAAAEAFGNLSKETGGSGSALKALGKELLGTGGILLAISLITTGLTIMAQKGLTVSDVFAKLTGTFDENRRSMQEINAETAKNAQAQISSVGAYVAAAKNINLSMSDRLIAVKKLQDEYPAYFGNLTKEQILNGQVASAVREVTSALIAKAKAAALTDRIVKLAEEEDKIQSSINNEILKSAKASQLSNKETFIAAELINKYLKGQIELGDIIQKNGTREQYLASIRADAYVRSNTALQDLGKALRANRADQDRLTNSLYKSVAASIKLEDTKDKTLKTKARVTIEAVPELKPVKTTDEQNDKLLAMMRDMLSEDLTKLKTEPIKLNIPLQAVTDTRAAARALIPYYKLFYEFTKNVDDLVTSSISSTFENLGTAIGEALASGGSVFGAIGKTLIASLGNFLSEMGSLLIKYGTLAVAKGVIDKALTSGNPIVTIGAGVAAIAVGVALKGVGSSIASRASNGGAGVGSGSTSSNISTGASYSSPASVSSSSGSSFGGGTVVFEIAGTSLIGVLGNTLDKNKRLGGSLSLG